MPMRKTCPPRQVAARIRFPLPVNVI